MPRNKNTRSNKYVHIFFFHIPPPFPSKNKQGINCLSDLINCFPRLGLLALPLQAPPPQTTTIQRAITPHNTRCFASACFYLPVRRPLIVSSATNKHISCCIFVYTLFGNKQPRQQFVCDGVWRAAKIKGEVTRRRLGMLYARHGEFDVLGKFAGVRLQHLLASESRGELQKV